MKPMLASFFVLGLLGGTVQAQEPKVENAIASTTSGEKSRVTQAADRTNSETCNQVWVNTATRVYHVQGSFWYGATAHGTYMCEADAKRAGNTRGQF